MGYPQTHVPRVEHPVIRKTVPPNRIEIDHIPAIPPTTHQRPCGTEHYKCVWFRNEEPHRDPKEVVGIHWQVLTYYPGTRKIASEILTFPSSLQRGGLDHSQSFKSRVPRLHWIYHLRLAKHTLLCCCWNSCSSLAICSNMLFSISISIEIYSESWLSEQ